MLLDSSFSSRSSLQITTSIVWTKLTSLPTGKGSVELFSEPLLCPDCSPALTLQRGRRRGCAGDPTAKPLHMLASDPAPRRSALCTSWVFSVLCLLHLVNGWCFIDTVSVGYWACLLRFLCWWQFSVPGSILFQLLVGCYHQVHSNRLSESIYWSCCWDAKCD